MAYENGTNTTMLVQPSGYGVPFMGNNGGLFGGAGDSWLGILFLIALCNGGFGGFGGFGGGYGAMMAGGWELYPWLNNSNQINDGFRDQMLNTTINGIQNSVTTGFGNVQTALCGGFAGVNASINGAQNAIAQQMYGNQIADLERSYAAQTASTQGMNAIQAQLAQCCCDNRAATADVKYTIATEACSTRNSDTQNTQVLLNAINNGIQSLKDQNCQDKIDAKNDIIAQLRQELMFCRNQDDRDVKTARILAGQTAEVDALYNRLNNCPVNTVPVYGRQPIFSCTQQASPCGCNNGFAANF